MLRFIAAVCFALVALAAGSARAENQALAAAVAEYERFDRQADPITAGYDGDRAALRRLPDVSRETELAQRATLTALRARVQAIDPGQLSDVEAVNRAILLRLMDNAIAGVDFDQGRMPFGNDDGFFGTGDYLARTTPIQSAEDAEAWLARLEALPAYYQQNVANMRRGIATRVTQPRIVNERVLAIIQSQTETLPETLLSPFAQLPSSIPAAAQDGYRARARALVNERIMPAHRAFVAFFQSEYMPASRRGIGIRSTPNGAAYYRYLARYHTTTDLTPDQIHALGEQEVARIRAEMDQVIAAAGFHGTFAQFLDMLHGDPRFYVTTPEALLEKSSEIAKRADDRLPRLFATLPRLPYGVRPVPADVAEGYTTARYWPGSPALGQAGGLMINTTHLDQRPLYELPALILHEGVPGHHLQIALAQEQGDLPYFRRNASFTAFVEGWGLYAESLGEDMGMYRTPYERFGRLSMEMWRACRLVADTGIHWLGWDIERARRCFAENSALSAHNIQTELERYIADPGQALAYKVGELRFQALRREAAQTLGARFDLRRFHDEALSAGAIPMDVLDARMHAWIAAQQRAAN
ncbi:MAG TPA: DUF885 family protein [Caulobacterales bacterium]|nr:DUF885 family protein [Caulobacterales bacterium]